MGLIDLLTGGIGQWVAGAVIALLTALGIWAKATSSANRKRDLKDAKADQAAHERMNNADLGESASDDERIERLRAFAGKHGNRSTEKRGR